MWKEKSGPTGHLVQDDHRVLAHQWINLTCAIFLRSAAQIDSWQLFLDPKQGSSEKIIENPFPHGVVQKLGAGPSFKSSMFRSGHSRRSIPSVMYLILFLRFAWYLIGILKNWLSGRLHWKNCSLYSLWCHKVISQMSRLQQLLWSVGKRMVDVCWVQWYQLQVSTRCFNRVSSLVMSSKRIKYLSPKKSNNWRPAGHPNRNFPQLSNQWT